MSVGKICVRHVDVAEMHESVFEVAERMHQRGVGSLVVLDEDRRLVGLVTDRDLVERVLAQGLEPRETRVEEIMTIDPTTISESASIESALERMCVAPCRRLPVLDDADELIGIVSLDDVLMLLAEELTVIGRLLQRETPRGIANGSARGL